MTLSEWRSAGRLTSHQTSPREIADLLALAERDLATCRTPGLHPDWRLNIAHNAALQLASAALAASGYRAGRMGHHYWAIQSLAHTIGAEQAFIDQLDHFRRKRNQTAYEHADLASSTEADEMIALAHELRSRVTAWLRQEHHELLS